MPDPSLLEALRTARLPIHFDEAHLQMLAAASERLTVAAGDVLFRQGDPSDAVYIVIDGCLEAAVRQDEGDEVVVSTLRPGTLFGEMQILTGGRRTASVYVREEAKLVKIGRTVIERLMAKSPELARPLANLIRDRLRHNRLVTTLPNLFGALDEAMLQDIERNLTWMRLQRGEALLRQGDQSNDVYVLISGRLLAVLEHETGQETVVGEVQPGEIVGEMAFFTGEPRAVSLYALRDVDLVRFTQSAFTYIIETYPQVIRAIMNLLIRRLRSSNQARTPWNAATNLAVVAISPGVSLDVFTERLAKELVPYGKTSVLNSIRIDQLLETPGVAQATRSDPNHHRLLALLDVQEAHHAFTIYTADPEDTGWTKHCIRQADLMLLVAEAHAEPALSPLEHHVMPDPLSKTKVRQVLVLLHPDGQQRPVGTARWLAPRQVERHLHLRWDTEADFGRLARIITGNAIGLVLGGGGARAAAHIGVIQALLEEDVPIDLIGGTSAGGGIAAQYALGFGIDQMREYNWKGFVENNPSRPYTLPIMSLAARHRADKVARMLYGDACIEDLWTSFFCLSCNLSLGTQKVHQHGPLWKAIRATTALPGVFVPFVEDQHLLVDGGLLDNLPYTTMQDIGAGVMILVDISSGETLTVAFPYEEMPTSWQVARSWLNPFSPTLKVPTLPDILMRTVTVSSLGKQQQARDAADLILHPPVDDYGMLEFKAMDALIKCGYEYTKERLASWPDRDLWHHA